EPFVLILGKSEFEDNVLAFDITEFAQAAAEAQERIRVDTFGSGPEKPDPPHLLPLLPLGGERRGEETTTEHRQEPAALRVLRDAAGEAGGLHRGAIVADNPEVYEATPQSPGARNVSPPPGAGGYLLIPTRKGALMAMSLTDSLKHNRYSVVAVDAAAGRLRVRSEAELCTDFACGEAAVVTDE